MKTSYLEMSSVIQRRYTANHPAQIGSEAHWVLRAFSPGVKLPGREADHSPPSSAEVKN